MTAYKVERYDLATDRSVTEDGRDIQHRFVQVVDLPEGASGLLLALDDGDFIPVKGNLRLQAWPETGKEQFARLRIKNNPSGGILSILCTNDPAPLLSASPAGGGLLDRHTDILYSPAENKAVGGVPPNGWLGRGANPGSQCFVWGGGAGNPDVQYYGRQCIRMNAGGNWSVARFNLWTMAWQRVMAGMTVRPDTARQSWNFEALIRREAVGGAKGGDHGMVLLPCAGVAPGALVAGNKGFGVVGNGAGGWCFQSRTAAGLRINDPLAWPGPITDFVRVRLQVLDADESLNRNGVVGVWLNNLPVKRYTVMAGFFPEASELFNGTSFELDFTEPAGDAAHVLSFADFRGWISKGEGEGQPA